MNTTKLFLFSLAIVAVGTISSCNKTIDPLPSQTNTPTAEPDNPTDPTDPADPTNPKENNDDDAPKKAMLTFTNKTAPVIFEMTSTGCPGCGGWGKPTFSKLSTIYGSDVTPVAVHVKYGDPMITTESTAIWDNIDGSRYTPMIFVQNENAVILNGGSISAASEQNARSLIDAAQKIQQPSISANVEKKGDKWYITYGAKFDATQAEGEYSISCYVMEDGLVHQQSNYANNPAKHNNVIRASTSGTWGDAFTGTDLMDKEVSFFKELSIDPSINQDNAYVTVLLWKKVNNRYEIVNGYTLK